MMQLKLCGPKMDPNATLKMDVAISDFLHSHCLPFSLAEDAKMLQLIQVARSLGPCYRLPSRKLIAGKYLDAIHETSYKQQMTSLLSEARIYGVTVFGDGAMIKSAALVNILAAGVNNPFAFLDIVDCTDHLAMGGTKDARYIADIVKPLITKMESEPNFHDRHSPGIVDLVFFMEPAMFKMLAGSSRVSIQGSQSDMVRSTLCHCSSPMFTARYLISKAVRVWQEGAEYLWLCLAHPQGYFRDIQPTA